MPSDTTIGYIFAWSIKICGVRHVLQLYLDNPSGLSIAAIEDLEALSHGAVLVFKVVYYCLKEKKQEMRVKLNPQNVQHVAEQQLFHHTTVILFNSRFSHRMSQNDFERQHSLRQKEKEKTVNTTLL